MVRGEETVIATISAVRLSLDPTLGGWVVTVIVAIVAVVGTIWSARLQNRSKPENAFIDQLQETMRDRDEFYKGQLAEIKQTAQTANDRAQRAEDSAKRNERRNIALLSYAYRLRDHIERRMEPPPPEWPTELND